MPVNRQPTEAEQLARTAHAKRLGPASQTIESLDIPKQLKIQEPVVLDLRNEAVRRSTQYAEKGEWAAAKKAPQPAHWPAKHVGDVPLGAPRARGLLERHRGHNSGTAAAHGRAN